MNGHNEICKNSLSNNSHKTSNKNFVNGEDEDTSDTVSIPDISEILKAAEALRQEFDIKEQAGFCQGKYSCYRPSNLGDRYYFCIYCKFDFARCYVDKHLKRKRHAINKKAFEDSANNNRQDINVNSKFAIKCKDNDGCFIKSLQFKNYVYCIYCKRNLTNKSSVLNVHLQSTSHLNHKAIFKGQNDSINTPKNEIVNTSSAVNTFYSSSDEENKENTQSFTRYLNLKKKYKKLQYCVYCKQHYKGSCVKDHLGRRKHKMLKRAFEETKSSEKIPIKPKTNDYCVYCKRYYLRSSMRYHVKTYKHIRLKKAYKEIENDKNKDIENKYEQIIESTGCFKKSSLGNKYAFCVYCQIDISFLRLINLEYHMKTTKHTLAKAAFEANCENETNHNVSDNEDEFVKFNRTRKKSKNSETRERGVIYISDSSLSLDEESTAAKIASILNQKRKRVGNNYLTS
uniref:Zinc finger protein n=1 Tax=Meloidogyne hapla TaxID=6305 RepID=A0A1I8C066_MELHA